MSDVENETPQQDTIFSLGLKSLTSSTYMRENPGFGLVTFGFALLLLSNIYSNATTKPNQNFELVSLALSGLLIFVGIIIVFLQFQTISRKITTEVEFPETTSSLDLEKVLKQLEKNYAILRNQTSFGFYTSMFFITLGFIALLVSIFGDAFGFTTGTNTITTVAGILIEFISATALFIYRDSFQKLDKTSDKLHHTWNVLMALNNIADLPEEIKANAKVKYLNSLITGKIEVI